MKIAVPSRHGRVLVLCGLSAALHLLCLEFIARHGAGTTTPVPGAPGPLVLRLAPAHGPAPARQPASTPPEPETMHAAQPTPSISSTPPLPSTPSARRGRGAPAAATAPLPAPSAPRQHPPQGQPQPQPQSSPPAQPSHRRPATTAPAASAAPSTLAPAQPLPLPDTPGGAPSPGNSDAQALVRYRVRMPPAVRLSYTLTRRDAAGRAAPSRSAFLDWRSDGEHYQLTMDGALGRLSSTGVSGDDGILPQRFVERRDARDQVTGFDPAAQRIVFADGSSGPGALGVQDRASLLMQLTGIGLARPGQVQDQIDIAVAGEAGLRIEHFQVMGQEALDTGAGRVNAWRIAQRVAAGEARLEVWLAPEQGWLPVQLRVTEADGSSATQVLARSEAAPAR